MNHVGTSIAMRRREVLARHCGLQMVVFLILILLPVTFGSMFAGRAGCWPTDTPLGALPPATPIFCEELISGPSTYTEGPNSWLDEFQHGLSDATMGDGYAVFEVQGPSILKSQHFRHNNHWMVDVAGHGRNPGRGLRLPLVLDL